MTSRNKRIAAGVVDAVDAEVVEVARSVREAAAYSRLHLQTTHSKRRSQS